MKKNNIASADKHREWITKNEYSAVSWRTEGYPKYKEQGALCFPAAKFKRSWDWFRGFADKADAETHRKWISENNYSVKEWQKEGYPKYRKEGASYTPHRTFDKPWSFFSGANTHKVSKDMSDNFFTQLNEFRVRLSKVIKNNSLVDEKITSLSHPNIVCVGWGIQDNVPSSEIDLIEVAGEGVYEYSVTDDESYTFVCYPESDEYTALSNFIDDVIIELYQDPKVIETVSIIKEHRKNVTQRIK